MVITPSSQPTDETLQTSPTLDDVADTDDKLERSATSAGAVEHLTAGELRHHTHPK